MKLMDESKKLLKKCISSKIIILLVLVLFVLSCESSESALSRNFREGYQGIEIELLSPTKPTYENKEFPIKIKLANKGAYDITEGEFTVTGFNRKYVELIDVEKKPILPEDKEVFKGRSALSSEGDSYNLEFKAEVKEIPFGKEKHDETYFIIANYKYKTELVIPDICIGTKLYEVQDAGCKVIEEPIRLNGQGSPLAVIQVEEITQNNPPKVEFIFTLKNKGRGEIKQAVLNTARLSHDPLDCDRKTFDFKEKKEIILICTKSLTDRKSYPTTIYLDFSFDYTEEQVKKLTIKPRARPLLVS